MPDSRKAVTLVITLLVAALLAGVLFPVAINEMSNAEQATYTQATGETVELQPGLNATVDSVTSGTSATYTINASGDTATTTVNVGANDTVTVDGVDVTIAPSEATSTDATTTYTYPATYGWGNGAGALWGILPVLLVLGVFLFLVGIALRQR